ncbi:efflux RND transporter periplasmic adaptor subunit [Wenzhouxiangella sediminis]|uniref:Efflux RND transporter periplasmic adaptor subunit n=1 Tax=Wenzhouxiangella sediminis TaxID=1792836 RepID=A0A3E1K5X2_9GAMM|nr:efflux RND transporter periplasmic adaptor subunit [Wenzhouxiangella sediminis]RFF29340.1 efflux RND transporter periplasmic adaptor subunit [Wenzhouxiangella sediminis]
MKQRFVSIVFLGLVLAACGESEEGGQQERATPVTTTAAEARVVERVELSVGRLRANSAPAVSAETGGRIREVHVDVGDTVETGQALAGIDAEVQQIAVNSGRAEIARIQALLDNERRRVRRLSDLADSQSIAQDQLDEARTAVESLKAQLDAAQARLDDAEYNLRQTTIASPVSGRIQSRFISVGDYVTPGMRVFELVSGQALQAFLPLPEHLQGEVELGQPVRLASPARPHDWIEAEVTDLRPVIGEGSRAIELIVALDNPGGWRAGGSVTGRVILERHEGLVVPPASVVRRSAGEVVYVVEGGRAQARSVRVGLRGDGWVEIAEGLDAGETVVVDGAGFLTDGALLEVRDRGAGA